MPERDVTVCHAREQNSRPKVIQNNAEGNRLRRTARKKRFSDHACRTHRAAVRIVNAVASDVHNQRQRKVLNASVEPSVEEGGNVRRTRGKKWSECRHGKKTRR
jgi:hypothetical protein